MGQAGLAGYPDKAFRHIFYPENLLLPQFLKDEFQKRFRPE